MDLPPWEQEELEKWQRQYNDGTPDNRQEERQKETPVILSTTDSVPAKKSIHMGLVQGSVVISRNVLVQMTYEWEKTLAGETDGYTRLMIESRKIATERMIEEARTLNANAVIGVRYSSADIMQGAVEILVYGTALSIT
ncbi:MAG: YbjQ family protein [Synergistaceae bacterium]|jgi:uncharacterized protein YbjQ (UPF0145 family)|nr:YbjQ family protein [Synergistaceae bacterium]